MTKTSKQVVFFGSGPVAASSLALLAKEFTVEAVVTKPTTLSMMQHTVPDSPIYTVSNKQELDTLITERRFTSTVGILIDFGIIVSTHCIDAFPKGIINSHFSLLPEWRGADPITFSLLSGQEKTGVSLMLLTAGMDEGPLLSQAELAIEQNDIAATLTERLVELSDHMLQQMIPLWLDGQALAIPQEQATIAPSTTPTYSRKITKQDGEIDWNKSATQIEREVRAFQSWPKSHIKIAGKDVVILTTHVCTGNDAPIGTIRVDGKLLTIQCSQDALAIDELKPAGKAAMSIEAFLAGYGRLLTDYQV